MNLIRMHMNWNEATVDDEKFNNYKSFYVIIKIYKLNLSKIYTNVFSLLLKRKKTKALFK